MLTDRLDPHGPGTRAHHKRATRQALLEAAAELFARNGYQATKVADITARAKVSPRTFFRYFNTKDEVLCGDHQAREARVAALLDARPTTEPVAATIDAVLTLLAAEAVELADRVTLLTRIGPESPDLMDTLAGHHRRIAILIACHLRTTSGQTDGNDPRPRLVAAEVVTLWETETVAWIESGCQGDLADRMCEQFAKVSDASALIRRG